MSKSINDILKTEYSEKFDEIRKNMMVVSHFKYWYNSITRRILCKI